MINIGLFITVILLVGIFTLRIRNRIKSGIETLSNDDLDELGEPIEWESQYQ